MLFTANEESWPRGMLNIEKLSLKRGDPITFPKIGVGKFMCYWPSALMMRVGEIVSEKIDDPDLIVDDVNMTAVIKEVAEQLNDSNSRKGKESVGSESSHGFSESEVEENAVVQSQQEAGPSKRRKVQQVENDGKCSKCGRFDGEKAALKQLAFEKMFHLASKIEQRLERSNQVQKDTLVLAKKVVKEISDTKDTNQERSETSNDENVEHVDYKTKCLTNLGGDTAEEKGKRIALQLWTKEELSNHVIDAAKTLRPDNSGRKRIDAEREDYFKKAMRVVLGSQYNKKHYRRVVRLINVMGNGFKNKGYKEDSD